jgi:hypothetical protein
MAHGDAREGKWRGNWRMEWVASTLHTTSKHGVSSITTDDAHTSAASSRLNWRPRRFKWTRPFRLKTKPGFCACAITFQTQSNFFASWVPSAPDLCHVYYNTKLTAIEDYPEEQKPSRCFGDHVIFAFAVPRYTNAANNVYNIVTFGRGSRIQPFFSHTIYR